MITPSPSTTIGCRNPELADRTSDRGDGVVVGTRIVRVRFDVGNGTKFDLHNDVVVLLEGGITNST
jgi:tryptophan synthase alpha subunit